MEERKTLAIITARGGSKRIPKKNIKHFCGKPIIAYSIETAINSGIFDEVMVSTDSEEIAEIAKKYGAKVPFLRSEETSNDFATTNDVLFEVLEEYKKKKIEFEYMCCIYPTAPFITVEKLKDGFQSLKEKNASLVMPVVQFSYPPQRSHVINKDGYISMKHPEYRNTRSQDLESIYHDCGQFYFYNVKDFYEGATSRDERVVPLVMSDLEVQDIDNETDWKLAELKYQLMISR